jgi:hypothetical protein
MNALGWLGPAVLISLLVLVLGLTVYPSFPAFPIAAALLALLVLGLVGYRRRSRASLTVDRSGLHVVWSGQKLDLRWDMLRRVKGATVWFDAKAVTGQPPNEVPAVVRRAVLHGQVPKIKLLTFTRSLTTGAVGDAIRARRPDLFEPEQS